MNKLFRPFIAVSALVAVLVVGCVTTRPVLTSGDIVKNGCLISHTVVGPAIDLSLQFGESDPVKRAEIRAEINLVSSNINALLATGQYDPKAIAKAFDVKDPYVNSLLATIPSIYDNFYTELTSIGAASNAVEILTCVSFDVATASTPTAMAQSIAEFKAAKAATNDVKAALSRPTARHTAAQEAAKNYLKPINQ